MILWVPAKWLANDLYQLPSRIFERFDDPLLPCMIKGVLKFFRGQRVWMRKQKLLDLKSSTNFILRFISLAITIQSLFERKKKCWNSPAKNLTTNHNRVRLLSQLAADLQPRLQLCDSFDVSFSHHSYHAKSLFFCRPQNIIFKNKNPNRSVFKPDWNFLIQDNEKKINDISLLLIANFPFNYEQHSQNKNETKKKNRTTMYRSGTSLCIRIPAGDLASKVSMRSASAT